MTPGPFRDHERWVAYNQHLMGGLVLGVTAAMLVVGGFWYSTTGLVVETAATESGDTGFAVVDITDELFVGTAIIVVGLTVWQFGWRQFVRARRIRKTAERRNVAAVAVTGMLLTALVKPILKNAGEEVSD